MKYKYGVYASGGASRLIKFFSQTNNLDTFRLEYVFYDGNRSEISDGLKNSFYLNVICPDNIELTSKKISSQQISDKILELSKKFDVDYIFCFGDKILKSPLIDHYSNKIINFHPSLLPSFPGLHSIDQALKTSVQILGNTAHFIDKGIDTGPIILQSVLARKDYKEYEDVLSLQIRMLEKIWMWLEGDKIQIKNNIVSILDSSIKSEFYSA